MNGLRKENFSDNIFDHFLYITTMVRAVIGTNTRSRYVSTGMKEMYLLCRDVQRFIEYYPRDTLLTSGYR